MYRLPILERGWTDRVRPCEAAHREDGDRRDNAEKGARSSRPSVGTPDPRRMQWLVGEVGTAELEEPKANRYGTEAV